MTIRTLGLVAAFSCAVAALFGCEVIAGIETKELAAGTTSGDGGAEPIRLGMTAALSGTSGALGTELRRGIDSCLKRRNKIGGVGGRPLVLDARDDQYDPAKAEVNARALLDVTSVNADANQPDTRGPNSVLALIGNVGTPTMQKTLPVATKNKVLYFAPFTGAQALLRDATRPPNVFNYRAGYFDETRAMVARIKEDSGGALPGVKNIIVFAQDDGYGDAGFNGIKAALAAEGVTDAPPRVNYIRDDVTSVANSVSEVRNIISKDSDLTKKVTIVMIDTYQIGASFIRLFRDTIGRDTSISKEARTLAATARFMHVSFVGPEGLVDELKKPPTSLTVDGFFTTYAQNVFVTFVVPSPDGRAPGLLEYRESIKEFDNGRIGPISLEGDLSCRLFLQGLDRAQGNYSQENLVKVFENLGKVDLGISADVSFEPTKHSASDNVWLAEMKLGADAIPFYEVIRRWDPRAGLRPE